MVDRLLGLGHHVVVSSDDDDGDVRDLGSTGTHSGEGFVPRGVEEGNALAVGELEAVGPDMLCDPPSLTCDDVRLAQVVEE